MPELHVGATLVSALAAFVAGAVYYGVLAKQLAAFSQVAASGESTMPPWKIAVELARCLVLAAVVAGLASSAEVTSWAGGVALGTALWVGFPAVLWTGAMLHERTPWQLAALHAGDWLLKLLLIGVIVGWWR